MLTCCSLICRVPTPVAVLISASVFALAHLTPGEFPQLFVLGNFRLCEQNKTESTQFLFFAIVDIYASHILV